MNQSSAEALLVILKCGIFLAMPPLIAGIEARDSTFPTANGDLNMALVVGTILLAMGALFYRGYRYQRRRYAIGKLEALAAVSTEALWALLGFTAGPICLIAVTASDNPPFVRVAGAVLGLWMVYKGVLSAWRLRHYVFT
jgi:hypothetical protein